MQLHTHRSTDSSGKMTRETPCGALQYCAQEKRGDTTSAEPQRDALGEMSLKLNAKIFYSGGRIILSEQHLRTLIMMIVFMVTPVMIVMMMMMQY